MYYRFAFSASADNDVFWIGRVKRKVAKVNAGKKISAFKAIKKGQTLLPDLSKIY